MNELVARWQDTFEPQDIDDAIRQSIVEMNAGFGQPLAEAMEDIRKELNIIG